MPFAARAAICKVGIGVCVLCSFAAINVEGGRACMADASCSNEGCPASGSMLLSKKHMVFDKMLVQDDAVTSKEDGEPDFNIVDTGGTPECHSSAPEHIHRGVLSFAQGRSSSETRSETGAGTRNDVFQPHWISLRDKDLSKSVRAKKLQHTDDGNFNTWGGAVTYLVDLGDVYHIEKLRIAWRMCKCVRKNAVRFESSMDGRKWRHFASPQLYVWGGKKFETYTTSTTGRYIRVRTTKASPVRYLAFWEFEIFGYMDNKRPNVYGWYHSYKAGQKGLAGTEVMHLVAYKGSLFAGLGFWMSIAPGEAQVARLDCPFCDWVSEWHISPYALRVESLKPVRWTTNRDGQPISGGPVDKFLSAFHLRDQGRGQVRFSSRNDVDKNWEEGGIAWTGSLWSLGYFSARAMLLHKDTVTKVDYLFLTTGKDGIVAGTYTASSKHTVSFDRSLTETESGPMAARPLSLIEHDGHVYSSSASYVIRRKDGPHPKWEKVFDMATAEPDVTVDEAVGGVRGLTSIVHPASPTGRSLLFSWSPNSGSGGCMTRLDPNGNSFTHHIEKCAKDLAKDYLGKDRRGKDPLVVYSIADYNGALEVPMEGGGQKHIVGFQILLYRYSVFHFATDPYQEMTSSSGKRLAYYSGSGFMIRHSATEYEVREPGGKRWDPKEIYPRLVAVRTYSTSPFLNDKALYFGGFDCNHFSSYNSAWVMRGEATAVYSKPVPCQKELGCGHVPGTRFRPTGCDLCEGQVFDGNEVYFFNKKRVRCQNAINWLNTQKAGKCSAIKKLVATATRSCCKGICNLCAGTGKPFRPKAPAAKDSAGNVLYKCRVALGFVKSGGIDCFRATAWWGGACCW